MADPQNGPANDPATPPARTAVEPAGPPREKETAGVILARAIAPNLHPVPLLATTLLLAVIALIAATVLGWDKGQILEQLKDGQYARGLITYLFAVGTVGAVVVLIVAALTAPAGDIADENFGRAKEIFSLLIGIFGTIIGFYFGSIKAEEEGAGGAAAPRVAIATVSDTVAAGSFPLIAYVTGGTAPYRYTLGFDERTRSPEKTSPAGWIMDSVRTPQVSRDSAARLLVTATDANDRTVTATAELVLRPSAPPPVPARP